MSFSCKAKLLPALLLPIFLALLTGCVADRAYRTAKASDLSDLQRTDKSIGAMIENTLIVEKCDGEEGVSANMQRTSLGFVEIDEQGSFWDRGQVNEAFKLVSGNGATDTAPTYVVIYVHGWRHDLRWGDDNVCKFKLALKNLRNTLDDPGRDEKGVRLVGIAVGWRGQAIDQYPLDLLTVLDRKSVSEEIGRGALVELLIGIEAKTKGLTADERKQSPNKLLLVGHSFGASVIHNALGPVLIERLTKDLYQREQIPIGKQIPAKDIYLQGFGDLVVLINPAIEAMRFLPLLELAHRATTDQSSVSSGGLEKNWPASYKLDQNQPPRLVIISSLGDFPTRRAFPVAQRIKTILEKHRPVETLSADGKSITLNQRDLDTTTIGNEVLLATHQTMIRTKPNDRSCPALTEGWLKQALDNSGQFSTGRGWKKEFQGSNILLQHNARYAATLPIWIMDVSTDIIANHSIVVGNGTLICLFDQLIGVSARKKTTTQSNAPPAVK